MWSQSGGEVSFCTGNQKHANTRKHAAYPVAAVVVLVYALSVHAKTCMMEQLADASNVVPRPLLPRSGMQ